MSGTQRSFSRNQILILLALLITATPAVVLGDPEATIRALRVTDPIRVDGLLDEPVWVQATPASGFRQREPREGEAATETTEIRVLYDERTLYIGILALDREPDKIIARILERDKLLEPGGDNAFNFAGDDAVALILDPFRDRRNAFFFATNPNGAQFDALITDESRSLNTDWRGVWAVATSRLTEEGAAPSQHGPGWSAEFAIPFRTLRYPPNGVGSWGFNVERIIRRKNEDTFWSAWSRSEGGLHRVSQAGLLVGLTDLPRSNFNIEVRPVGLLGVIQKAPPDGAAPAADVQWRVGADAKWELHPGLVLDATVRPDFAQVEADAETVNLTRFELFFPEKREFFLENAGIFDFGTRSAYETPPFLLFFSRRIGIADQAEVPVLGGVRLTGRTGRQTLGLLNMVTESVDGLPATNYSVARLKRDVGERGYVGGIVADRRSRDGDATDVGADASLWLTGKVNVQAFAARTRDAVGRADSAWRVSAEYLSDPLFFSGDCIQIGAGAKTAVGFVTRTDIRRTTAKAQYALRPGALGLRRVDLFTGGKYLTRMDGSDQDGNLFSGLHLEWESGENLNFTEVRGFTVLDWGFPLAGRVPILPGRYHLGDTEIFFGTSWKRPVTAFIQISILRIWEGRISSATSGVQARSGSRLLLGATYTRNEVSMPAGGFHAHVGGLRIGWTQSTRLSAATYLQYNTLNRRFIANFRVHCIHRPGSDLFLVFNEERGVETAPWSPVSRGFAVKLNYLIRL